MNVVSFYFRVTFLRACASRLLPVEIMQLAKTTSRSRLGRVNVNGLLLFAAAPDPDGQPGRQWSAPSSWDQLIALQ